MDDIILLEENTELFNIVSDLGVYVDGIWHPNEVITLNMRGVIFPVNGSDLRSYPVGLLTLKDFKLYSAEINISPDDIHATKITRVATQETFQLITVRNYMPHNVLVVYFLRSLEGLT